MSKTTRYQVRAATLEKVPLYFATILAFLFSMQIEAQVQGTLLSGQEYINECASNGVPIPPSWGSTKWEYVGTLAKDEVFISEELEARVFKYESDTPEGSCIALPRINLDSDEIALLGIICLGIKTSNACFWDNQENKVNVPIPVQKSKPLIEFAGGADLLGGSGGECTSCHVGENSYVIHPKTALGFPMLGNLKVEPNAWYRPIVHPDWHQNPLPTKDILADVESKRECTGCHRKDDSGGRFPELFPGLGYCLAILQAAATRTMPPRKPMDDRYETHVNKLYETCGIQLDPGPAPADVPLFTEDPIASIGHGAFFDKHGKQIPIKKEFLLKAQQYYMADLNSGTSVKLNSDFSNFKSNVPNAGADEQGALIANSALLDWLSVRTEPDYQTKGKLALIHSVLKRNISEEDSDLEYTPSDEMLDFVEQEGILNHLHRKNPEQGAK